MRIPYIACKRPLPTFKDKLSSANADKELRGEMSLCERGRSVCVLIDCGGLAMLNTKPFPLFPSSLYSIPNLILVKLEDLNCMYLLAFNKAYK